MNEAVTAAGSDEGQGPGHGDTQDVRVVGTWDLSDQTYFQRVDVTVDVNASVPRRGDEALVLHVPVASGSAENGYIA